MRGNLLGELTYRIMEADKAYDRPSVSRRTREAHSLPQSKTEGPRTSGAGGVILSLKLMAWKPRGSCWCMSWSPKAREPGVLSLGQEKGIPAPEERECKSTYLSYPGPQQIRWSPPSLTADLLYLVH